MATLERRITELEQSLAAQMEPGPATTVEIRAALDAWREGRQLQQGEVGHEAQQLIQRLDDEV